MKVLHYRYATLPYRNTFNKISQPIRLQGENVFLYGRGTENRTLICWLKASYFTIKLYPHRFLVTVHYGLSFKNILVLSPGYDPEFLHYQCSVMPLYYESMAEGKGIEPLITESKSVVIPFN